jgi:hypothetical protein
MPEILTESFCERCGTRYTFESAQPKGARLKGIKTVSRGLRNFVMSDDTSMDEAMASARNETDREATSQQLDAFHKTFNFCMSCRQYTCSNCWNEVEGRCLSCAPSLGHEVLPAPFPNLDTSNGLPFGLTAPPMEATNGHEHAEPQAAPMSWPTSDLMQAEEAAAITFDDVIAQHEAQATSDKDETFDPLARLAALDAGFEPETVTPSLVQAEAEPEAIEAVEAAVEPVVASVEPVVASVEPAAEAAVEPVAASVEMPVEPEPAVMPEPVAAAPAEPVQPVEPEPIEDDRAAAAVAQTTDLLNRFRPGQNLDDAIAAFERAQATDDAIAAYERTQVAADALADQPADLEPATPAPAPEPVAPTPEPEPVAAAPEPEVEVPEPIAAAPEPEPVAAAPEPVWPVAEPEEAPVPFRLPDLTPATSADELDRVAASSLPPESWTQAPDVEPSPEPEPIAAEVREDVVPQPTWQIMAPDTTGEPEWPAPPAWPGAGPSEGLPFLGRPAQPTGGIDALWAESARQVTSTGQVPPPTTVGARPAGGVQPCVSCGLSLSANARFCRRCGTRQD